LVTNNIGMLVIILLMLILVLQIILLYLSVCKSCKLINKSIKEDIKYSSPKELQKDKIYLLQPNTLQNIDKGGKFELIRQIIDLQDYMISFITPYNGYLYLTVETCEIRFNNKIKIPIIKNLEKLYLEKGTMIFIINPIGLKSIRFKKLSV